MATLASNCGQGTKRKRNYITLCINITFEGSERKHNYTNRLIEFDTDCTWHEVLADTLADNNDFLRKTDIVEINLTNGSVNVFHPHEDDVIEAALCFDRGFKFVSYKIKPYGFQSEASTPGNSAGNTESEKKTSAFDILMGRQLNTNRKFAALKETTHTAKDRLFNDLAEQLRERNVGFPSSMGEDIIQKHVSVMVNAIWYLDGNHSKILSTKASKPTQDELHEDLQRFLVKFQGFNDWKKKKRKAPSLNASLLKAHSGLVFGLVSSSFAYGWGETKRLFEYLAQRMNGYADYLEKQNQDQKMRQEQDHPPREVFKHAYLEQKPAVTDTVKKDYEILDNAVSLSSEYSYICFDEEIHVQRSLRNRFDRLSFLNNLQLSVPINILRYDPGGSQGSTVFVWRVPIDRGLDEVMNRTMQVVEQLKPKFREYHTRRMRREFIQKYTSVQSNIPKHILREIYVSTTMDATVDQNPCMDARVRQGIQGEDPELVMDLRHLNPGRPNDTFSVFFDILQAKVEELSAADERRHNIEHIAKYISVRDLIEDVRKELADDVPVPSESTVLFAFAPKNAYLNTARLYKAKIPLQFKVQTRQIRMCHQDDHYCAAINKYMRSFAQRYKENVTFLSIDDKSKIDIGEPGQFVATGVRGKKSIVPSGSQLSAMDHDVSSKGSLTPSVCLKVDIPAGNEAGGSFYRGQVTVTYKDAVFQASTPFRHIAELQAMLQKEESINPILMIYSDGGPDHRLTYHSVKLSLIVLFKNLDLDLLIAGRTAPGHSWLNPVERIMSILNLALQNTALAREECSSDVEQALKSANSMAELRKKAEHNPAIREEWIKSLETLIAVLTERTEKLTLKDVPFKCEKPAPDVVVKAMENQVRHDIDPNIEPGKYQHKDVKSKAAYMRFLEKHCIERQYIFQIRKCDDRTCCRQFRAEKTPVLPDPMLKDLNHYKPFDEVLGTDTAEGDRPSSKTQTAAAVAEDVQGCKNNILTAQNVRRTVECVECGKPRCIYSKAKLTMREYRALTRLLEKYQYTCGAMITADGDVLQGVVFVRLQLSCSSKIEFPFYSAAATKKDLCCYCAQPNTAIDADLLKEFRVVLPVCQDCLSQGKEKVKRQPKK